MCSSSGLVVPREPYLRTQDRPSQKGTWPFAHRVEQLEQVLRSLPQGKVFVLRVASWLLQLFRKPSKARPGPAGPALRRAGGPACAANAGVEQGRPASRQATTRGDMSRVCPPLRRERSKLPKGLTPPPEGRRRDRTSRRTHPNENGNVGELPPGLGPGPLRPDRISDAGESRSRGTNRHPFTVNDILSIELVQDPVRSDS